MPKVELWTRERSAKYLDMSERRLMEISADGKPKRYRDYDPETKREAVMFNSDDIERMKKDAEVKAKSVPAPNASARLLGSGPAAPRLLGPGPAEAAKPAGSAVGRSPHQRWITIDEAVEYIGLPAAAIRQLIESGRLPAIDVGVRPGGHLRVSWRDLDAIEGAALADGA